MRKSVALSVLLALVSSGAAFSDSRAPTVKALVGGRVIDGHGGRPIDDGVVLIEGETIKAVGRQGEVAIPKGAEIISTEGMDVLPGLWDMHVHLMIVGHADYDHWDKTYPAQFGPTIMPAAARQLLLAGVTSARDLGAPLAESIEVRERINRGEIPGPTMYVTGPFLQHEPYPGTEAFRWGISGPDDARAKVDKLADAGVNLIKLIDQDQMTQDEVNAVVAQAHKRGLSVTAHAHRAEEIRRGIAAGVDGFEHTGLGTAPGYPEDVLALLRNRGYTLFWTPTVAPLLLYEETRDNPERLDDPRWRLGLPQGVIDDILGSIARPDQIAYYRYAPSRRPTVARKFRELWDSGVRLLVGTDSGIPMLFHSDSTWREIVTWVRVFGVEPMEALRAATYWPAVAQKVDAKVGTLAAGKQADVIAVRGDVLRTPELLSDVDIVIKRGVRYK